MPSVRLASLADAGALEAIRLAWAAEKGAAESDPAFHSRFDDWYSTASENRRFWLAEIDGEPVGMVNLAIFGRMPYPDSVGFASSWGYLGNLFVLPAHRGHGLGQTLVEACMAYAAERGFARVVLSPSAASIPLYERAGFRAADELMVWRP